MRNRRPLWPVAIVRAMTRIPYLPREELGPEGQQLWDAIVDGRSNLVVTAEGGLAGPFNAFVTAPGAGRRLSSLGAKLRFGTSIERRLSRSRSSRPARGGRRSSSGGRTRPWRASTAWPARWWTRSGGARIRRSRRRTNGP